MVQGDVGYGSGRSTGGAGLEADRSRGRAVNRMYMGMAALAMVAVATVLVVSGGRLGSSEQVELEERYHGDPQALSSEGARKQAETMFDNLKSKKRLHHKFYKQHTLKHGMSADAARSDLFSFFDTLGLNGNKHKASHTTSVDVHSKLVKKNDNRKTVVNVYIDASKPNKAVVKPAVKPAGIPVPLKAKEVQLAQQSKYQREMAEARKLLGGSKIQKALAQARTLSLKAEAPYFTG